MVQDAPYDMVAGDILRFRFVGRDDAVAQDIGGDLLDIFRGHEAAPLQEGVRPCGRNQIDARPRRSAELDQSFQIRQTVLRRFARGQYQVEDVILDLVVHVDLLHHLPRAQNILRCLPRGWPRATCARHAVDDHTFLFA